MSQLLLSVLSKEELQGNSELRFHVKYPQEIAELGVKSWPINLNKQASKMSKSSQLSICYKSTVKSDSYGALKF